MFYPNKEGGGRKGVSHAESRGTHTISPSFYRNWPLVVNNHYFSLNKLDPYDHYYALLVSKNRESKANKKMISKVKMPNVIFIVLSVLQLYIFYVSE